jgi:hypothetical protein
MSVDFDYLLPPGRSLLPFQQVGVAYALVATADGKGAWIADEQGLGKTLQSLVVCKARGARRILIIVKSSLKANWEREVNLAAPEWSCQILGGTEPYQPYAQCVIISFDLLATWADALLTFGFDALIVDESHYIKGAGTKRKPVQRTVAALRIAKDIRQRGGLVLLLSGTPLLNRPEELITQLDMIGRLRDITPRPCYSDDDAAWAKSFKYTFCESHHNDLLNLRMRSRCMVRRLRRDVLGMNDTHRVHTPLSLNGRLDAYKAIVERFQCQPKGPGAYLKLMSDLRLAVGLAKVDAAVDWIQTFLIENPGKKLVVWAWHVKVQQAIARKVKGIYFGQYESGSQEQEAAKREFNEGQARVIVCSLEAHREGHTLIGTGHNVTDSLFVESPWGPGAVSQAEDRISRIGQEADVVFATTLVVPDTVDEWLVNLIRDKWSVFKAVADGTTPESQELDIQNIILGRLRAQYN